MAVPMLQSIGILLLFLVTDTVQKTAVLCWRALCLSLSGPGQETNNSAGASDRGAALAAGTR